MSFIVWINNTLIKSLWLSTPPLTGFYLAPSCWSFAGFDLFFHIQWNISWSWMSATVRNDCLPKAASLSALLGPHALMCTHTYTHISRPAADSVNQSSIAVSEQVATCWVKKGHGEKCSQSLSINPPLLPAWRDSFSIWGGTLAAMAHRYWFIILFSNIYGQADLTPGPVGIRDSLIKDSCIWNVYKY